MTTTSAANINSPDITGTQGGHYRTGTGKGQDASEQTDSDRDDSVHADQETSRRVRAVAKLHALPNGEWAIRSENDLRTALNRFVNPPHGDRLSDTYGPDDIQRHIIISARRLGRTAMLPDSWGVNQEIAREITKRNADFVKTYKQLELESRNFTAAQRRKYASAGVALPDGSFPIPDPDALRRAIRLVGKGGRAAKRHIIKRAKALGKTASLPSSWSVSQEPPPVDNSLTAEGEALNATLVLDGDKIPLPLVLEDNTTDEGGFVRIKVPFYIGDSISKAPGFYEKILFPTGILQEVVASGKDRITRGQQPLTVYSRHSHATGGNHLPIGGIVDLVQDGKIGYAICDVVNEGEGKQSIALMKHKPPLLNAVSLRSSPKNFVMERVKAGDESMLRLKKLDIDGVDFAPDSPAMPTYGIQMLAAETPVVPVQENIPKKEEDLATGDTDNLTLESLAREYPTLVEEIESPLRDQIVSLQAEVSKRDKAIETYRDDEKKRALEAFVQELAEKTGRKDEALPVFMGIAKDCKSRDEFTSAVMPFMMEYMGKGGQLSIQKVETTEEKLQKLFPTNGGVGQVQGDGLTQEEPDEWEKAEEKVGMLPVPE